MTSIRYDAKSINCSEVNELNTPTCFKTASASFLALCSAVIFLNPYLWSDQRQPSVSAVTDMACGLEYSSASSPKLAWEFCSRDPS